MKKKLRGGPIIDVDPQILRWREKRKKLGLYKPARAPKKVLQAPPPESHKQTTSVECPITLQDAPRIEKLPEPSRVPAASPPEPVKTDLWDVFK